MLSVDIPSKEKLRKTMENHGGFDLLTAEEVAKMLRVKPLTIYRRLKEGKIQGWKIEGLWRIPRSELMIYLRKSTVTNAPKPKLK
jgi:excisionase family DNA binding protein